MKSDLDRLMAERGLDAIVVAGAALGNPPMYYLTGGGGIGKATIVVKRRDEMPVLIANPMEREEAAKSGYPIRLTSEFDYMGYLRAANGDALAATVAYYRRILDELGVRGKVGFYGNDDRGRSFVFLQALAAASPEITVAGEFDRDLFTEARATKTRAEADRISEVGRRTVAVVRATVDFLHQQTVGPDETLRQADGSVLTVGTVHAHIRRLIAAQGLEDPEGFIFATGRDAGIPHNKGMLSAPLRLGESIVFDIFPQEAGGGYFFDFTRTFALGYAPEPLQQLYQDVRTCQERVLAALQAGEEARRYQQMACEHFKQRGHPTIDENPQTLCGYIHSLGHGVGLMIHESPALSDAPGNLQTLQPGHVFTVEPGLYYPDQGMGVRLEDMIWIDEAGTPHNLTDYPYDLVVEMG